MATVQDITASSLAGMLAIAPSNTTTPGPDNPEKELRNWSSLIGIVTAIVGNVLIALALNVQRYAHIRLHRERARIKERARLAERRTASPEHNTSHYGALNSIGAPADERPRTSYFDGVDEATWGRNDRRSSHGVVLTGGGEEDDDQKAPASSYLRSPYWWLGQVLISLGEMGNFLAYGFAPASIVSPLGVVALISNCVIAPMLFKETFRQRDFWGVVIAVGGVVTVVLSANQQETKLEPHDVWLAITTLEFEIYLAVTGFLIVALMWISSTFHHRTILVDLGLVGLFGGYTALATKGVSSMLSSTLWRAFTTPVTYALILVLLSTAIMQIRYVNKALQRSDSTVVIPIQFVMFTLCVIIGSAVLYRDFENTTPRRAVKFIGGCLLTFFGVFLITSGRPPKGEDEESYVDMDDPEEAIGLLRQGHEQSPNPPGDTVRSRTSSRSSRSSRINFDAFTKPFSFQHGSGMPSPRGPRHEPAKLSSSNNTPNDPNSWLTSDDEEATAGDFYGSPTSANRPNVLRQDSATSDLLITEPSTPRASVSPLPFASEPQLTTPNRPSTARLHSRHRTGPLINPSPLSSTVSAVVTDTLRRHGDSPLLHKSSLGRIRSSIRASLYISDDDDDDDEREGQGRSGPREPLLGDLTDVDEGEARGEEEDPKRRARSLSDTLGELFRPRKRANDDGGNGAGEGSGHM